MPLIRHGHSAAQLLNSFIEGRYPERMLSSLDKHVAERLKSNPV